MSKNISTNLTYGEAINSAKAKALGIDNNPPEAVLLNMKHWAKTIFEPTRAHFNPRPEDNNPLFVSSFYRAPKLNVAVGGSATSQHSKGEAGDIDGDVYDTASNVEIFEFIRDNLNFDQLIIEGITGGKIAWVHVSTRRTGQNRGAILFMYKHKGKTIYENYTEKRYKQLVYAS